MSDQVSTEIFVMAPSCRLLAAAFLFDHLTLRPKPPRVLPLSLRDAVTAVLRDEHALIRRFVGVLRHVLTELAAGRAFPAADIARIAGFLREFAEHQHHRKEEGLLLAALAAAGPDDNAESVGQLFRDHEDTRELLYTLTLFWEPTHDLTAAETEAFIRVATAYADRIERHMMDEEAIFFPLADRILSGDDQIELLERFAESDADRTPPADWQRVVAVLEERWC